MIEKEEKSIAKLNEARILENNYPLELGLGGVSQASHKDTHTHTQ